MVEIKLKEVPQDQKEMVGKLLCSTLVGERAFVIDNDIMVNYTDYDDIIIVLGRDTHKTTTLTVKYEEIEF